MADRLSTVAVRFVERGTGRDDRPAFFEVFLRVPATFIRGEGVGVEEAEAEAWAAFRRIQACGEHVLVRNGYRNGAGFCKECGLFVPRAFRPIELTAIERGQVDELFGGMAGKSVAQLWELEKGFTGERRGVADRLSYALVEMLMEVADSEGQASRGG